MTRDQDISLEVGWTRPEQTYGELKGYKLKYGIKDQLPLLEVNVKNNTREYRLDHLGTLKYSTYFKFRIEDNCVDKFVSEPAKLKSV